MPFEREAAAPTETAELSPSALLDFVTKKLELKNDAALSRALCVAPPVISKIRHGSLAVGATILIAMHEETGMSVAALRQVMGDRRLKFRSDDAKADKAAAERT